MTEAKGSAGADARSPEAVAAELYTKYGKSGLLPYEIAAALRAAESRGAKAARLEALKIAEWAVDATAAEGVRQHGDPRLGAECREAGLLTLGTLRALIEGPDAQRHPGSPSGFERGRQAGTEEAKQIETAAKALLLTFMRPSDPMWCGCCASALGEHKKDCAAAALVRALVPPSGSPSVPAQQKDQANQERAAAQVPDPLRRLSPEELADAPRITKEQIEAALDEGRKDSEAMQNEHDKQQPPGRWP